VADLGQTLLGEDRHTTRLGDIAGPVEKGALPPEPEPMPLACGSILGHQGFGNDGPAQTHPGKTGELGEAVDLDGALHGPGNLVNRFGQKRVANVLGIGGIEYDDGLIGPGIFDKRA